MTRILIADDHQIFIDGLKALLSNDKRFEVVAEANNGNDVLEQLEKKEIDVVVLDVNMPEMNGIETTKIIAKKYPHISVLMLTMYNRKEFIIELLQAGASGYVLKNCSREELTEAIISVDKGKNYFSRDVTDTVMEGLKKMKSGQSEINTELSKREIEILKLIVQEMTTKEIAEKLFISESTVETHRRNLISKLGVRNTAGLVRYAMENKIID